MRQWLGVVGVVALGCGGASAKPASTPAAGEPEQAVAASKGVTPLSAGPMDGIRLHLGAPARDLPLLARWFKAPPFSEIFADPGRFMPVMVGDQVARSVDLSSPIDAVMTVTGKPNGAVAFRVRDSQIRELRGRELSRGRLRLLPDVDAQLGACELWERAPARVVCAKNAETLDALAPALIAAPPPSSLAGLVLEASGPTYTALVAKAFAEQEAKAESEDSSERAGRLLATEVLRHEKLTLEIDFGEQGVELALAIGYGNEPRHPLMQSWLEDSLVSQPLPEASVPGMFTFAYAGTPAFTAVRDAGLSLMMDDFRATTQATPEQLKELQATFKGLLPATGRITVVSGADPETALLRLNDEPKATTPAQRRKLDQSLGAWSLIALDVPPAEYLDAVKRGMILNAVNVKDKPGAPDKPRPTSSTLTTARKVPPGLPAGSIHLTDTVKPKANFVPDAKHPREDQRVLHYVITPDPARGRVWIAVSRSEVLAATQARAALASPKAAPQAAGPALSLRMTPAGLVALAATFDNVEEVAEAHQALLRLPKLASKGRQEVEIRGQVRRVAGSSPGMELRLHAKIPSAATAEWLDWLSQDMAAGPKP